MRQKLSNQKKRSLWRQINNIWSIFFDVCIVLAIFYFGYFHLIKNTDEMPIQFRVVLSDSMKASFPAQSLIVVKKTTFQELQPGDIITFYSQKEVVSHRIVSKEAKQVITKGDSNLENDQDFVSQDQIIGKVIGSVPYLGTILLRTQTLRGKLALTLTILNLWLLKLFFRILLEPEEREQTNECTINETN